MWSGTYVVRHISGVLPACGGFPPESHILQSLLLTSGPASIPSTQPDPVPAANLLFGVQIHHRFQDAVTRVTKYCKLPQGCKVFIVCGPLYKNDFADSLFLPSVQVDNITSSFWPGSFIAAFPVVFPDVSLAASNTVFYNTWKDSKNVPHCTGSKPFISPCFSHRKI